MSLDGRLALAAQGALLAELRQVLEEAESDPALAAELLARFDPRPVAARVGGTGATDPEKAAPSSPKKVATSPKPKKPATGKADSDLVALIDSLAARYGGMAPAAREAGVSVESLRAWRQGTTKIGAAKLEALRVAAAKVEEGATKADSFRSVG